MEGAVFCSCCLKALSPRTDSELCCYQLWKPKLQLQLPPGLCKDAPSAKSEINPDIKRVCLCFLQLRFWNNLMLYKNTIFFLSKRIICRLVKWKNTFLGPCDLGTVTFLAAHWHPAFQFSSGPQDMIYSLESFEGVLLSQNLGSTWCGE